ncbi:MAG: hypothetical protein IJ696_05605 [Ruminococcus sp.]|nr:hypothetical protein [Ruminococcus sp.]
MKITAFNPMILTKNAEETIAIFEALGFEKRHTKTGINDKDISAIDMKNPDGFRISIVKAEMIPQDFVSIRMNVRDLDETIKTLEEKGFKNAQGAKITDTGSSKATMMVSPSGFSISVAEHIRKDQE